MKHVYLAAAALCLVACGKEEPAPPLAPLPPSSIAPAPIQSAETPQPEVSEPPTADDSEPVESEITYEKTECAANNSTPLTRSEIIAAARECKVGGLRGLSILDGNGQVVCVQCDPSSN